MTHQIQDALVGTNVHRPRPNACSARMHRCGVRPGTQRLNRSNHNHAAQRRPENPNLPNVWKRVCNASCRFCSVTLAKAVCVHEGHRPSVSWDRQMPVPDKGLLLHWTGGTHSRGTSVEQTRQCSVFGEVGIFSGDGSRGSGGMVSWRFFFLNNSFFLLNVVNSSSLSK